MSDHVGPHGATCSIEFSAHHFESSYPWPFLQLRLQHRHVNSERGTLNPVPHSTLANDNNTVFNDSGWSEMSHQPNCIAQLAGDCAIPYSPPTMQLFRKKAVLQTPTS